jgi:hypothetical protein
MNITALAKLGWLLVAGIWVACNDPSWDRVLGSKQQSIRSGPARSSQLALKASFDLGLEHGQVVVRGGWGAGTGEFGKRDEASRPGPMSLAVDDAGTIYVLDQVNRRIVAYRADGQLDRVVQIESETTEEVAVGPGQRLWVLAYEPGVQPGFRITRYDGEVAAQQVPLRRSIQLVTGIFVTGTAAHPSVWVEQRHDIQTRVVGHGRALKASMQTKNVLGRPDRARPESRLTARKVGPYRALVIRVLPGRSTHRELTITTPLPIIAIQELESDRAGNIFLGLLLGENKGPPEHELVNVRKVMLVHRGPGRSPLTVQLEHERATDLFRQVAVGPDGSIYQLHTTEQGVSVRRWTLPEPQGGVR